MRATRPPTASVSWLVQSEITQSLGALKALASLRVSPDALPFHPLRLGKLRALPGTRSAARRCRPSARRTPSHARVGPIVTRLPAHKDADRDWPARGDR